MKLFKNFKISVEKGLQKITFLEKLKQISFAVFVVSHRNFPKS